MTLQPYRSLLSPAREKTASTRLRWSRGAPDVRSVPVRTSGRAFAAPARLPGARAAGLGPDPQRILQDHDQRARYGPAGQTARDAAIVDAHPRSDLRVLVRLFPGHDGQSDDRLLQQPRDRKARDLPAGFRRGYRGPEIACGGE